jgi:hypothetical protein
VHHVTLFWQALVARTTPLFSNFLFPNLFSIKFLGAKRIKTSHKKLINHTHVHSHIKYKIRHDVCNVSFKDAQARTTPLFSNFLFPNLFSIKFLYFFIISSLFPYFNLFVSIFIQSYVNIKLHVSTQYMMSIILRTVFIYFYLSLSLKKKNQANYF